MRVDCAALTTTAVALVIGTCWNMVASFKDCVHEDRRGFRSDTTSIYFEIEKFNFKILWSGSHTLPAMADDVATRIRTAITRSTVLWIGVPGGPHHIAWFARASHEDGTALVISGTGEQELPVLPDPSEVILRQRDNHTPTGPLQAHVELIAPHDPRWDGCVADLVAARQGVPTEELLHRWRVAGKIWAVSPRATGPLHAAG